MKNYLIFLILTITLKANFSLAKKKEIVFKLTQPKSHVFNTNYFSKTNFLSDKTFSEDKKYNFPFNEFNFSINKYSKIGFGVGIYHNQYLNKKFSTIIGLEYNHAINYIGYIYQGHYIHTENENEIYNIFSLPLAFRVNIDKKNLLYFESGIFIDYIYSLHKSGTTITEVTQNGQYDHVETVNYNTIRKDKSFHPGIDLGIVLKIPIKNNAIVLKIDYKYSYVRYARFSIGYTIK